MTDDDEHPKTAATTSARTGEVEVDCESGRRMGCATFCCRLIVRLAPGERAPEAPHDPEKRCVDKDPATGLCVHLDTATHRCKVWQTRPSVCRGYDCNDDPLLQSVLRHGFNGLVELVRRKPEAARPVLSVPYRLRQSTNEEP